MVEAGGQHIQAIFHKKACMICFFVFKWFSLEPQFEFSIIPVFFLQKQGDDWSTLGAKFEGLMFNHQWYWHESPQAPWQTVAMQILEDLFPFFKGFFAQSAYFFKGSLEIRKNKHKSQVTV